MNNWLNKIICGDAVKVMSEMPDQFIDLIVTSPPYDKLRDYKGYCFDFESMASEMFRVLKNGGVAVWIVNDQVINGSENVTSARQKIFFYDLGFKIYDTMIYQRESLNPEKVRYKQQFEYVFILSKGKPKTFNPMMVPCINAGLKNKSSSRREKDGGLY